MPDTFWTPQVVAAFAGFGGVVMGSLISWGVQTQLLGRRIEADETLAQRKFESDKELAERKFTFDKEIAERKFKYDRELHDHKCKTELAEQALTAFYEARDAFIWVRSRGIFGAEGSTRTPAPGETATQQEKRNTYFIPIERLTREKTLFVKIQSLRYAFAAEFGESAVEPFKAIWGAHNEIHSAASVLIQITRGDDFDGVRRRFWIRWVGEWPSAPTISTVRLKKPFKISKRFVAGCCREHRPNDIPSCPRCVVGSGYNCGVRRTRVLSLPRILHRADQEPAHAPRLRARGDGILRLA